MATTKITNPNLFDLSTVNTALRLPNGGTATRPTSPSQGEWRFNTDLKYVEFYDGNNWRQIDTEVTCTTNTVDYPTTNTAYYKLDSSAADQTTNNHDGTSTDITYYNGQQYSQGAVFNGSSSFISASNILDTSAAFSYSLWIKPNEITTNDYLIGHQQAPSPYDGVGLIAGTALNTFAIAIQGGAPQSMTPALTLNTWSHIVLTHDGSGGYTCYTNNNGSPITYSGATSNNSANPFRLGFSGVSGWGYYDGSIDQVRLFTTELTASQVTELYNEVQCPCTTDNNDNPTTNVAYYKLDGNANDSTTSANNGTWNGSEAYEYGPYGIAASGFSTSNFIDIPGITGVIDNVASYDFTFSIWFKLNAIPASSSNFNTICGVLNGDTSGSNAQMWEVNLFGTSTSNEIEIRTRRGYGGNVYDPSSYGITKVVAAGRWYNLVCAYTGSTKVIEIYIDGVSLGSNTLSSASSRTVSNGFNLGAYSTDGAYSAFAFNGVLDQVRIFSDVLSATQVTSLYDEVYCNTVSKLDIFNEGTSSCLALYEFEDNADSTESSSYDGTWFGTEAYGGGQYKKAGIFNGSTSKIVLPTLSSDFVGANSRSVSAWVRITSTPSASLCIFNSGDAATLEAFGYFIGNSRQIIISYYNKNWSTSEIISLNTWNHIVFTYNGGAVETSSNSAVYINGTLATLGSATGSATGSANTSNTNHAIGVFNATSALFFDGSIDQVRLFNKELTATEVLQVYTE